ncbi:MAG: hypothetical protein H6686_11520 [Fibrobacteria bacterium]|nr:hypothetical protein [Fibrobacteria bacterium]
MILTDTLTQRERVSWQGAVVVPASADCQVPIALPERPEGAAVREVLWGQTEWLDTAFHGEVHVKAGANLVVRPERYSLKALVLEWDARLEVDTSGQHDTSRMELVIAERLTWMDRVQNRWPGQTDSAAASRIRMLVQEGEVAIGYDAVVRGSLWAPHSPVLIQDRALVVGQVLSRSQVWGWDSRGRWVAPRFLPSWSGAPPGVVIHAPRESHSSAFSWPVSWSIDGIGRTPLSWSLLEMRVCNGSGDAISRIAIPFVSWWIEPSPAWPS